MDIKQLRDAVDSWLLENPSYSIVDSNEEE